jgi:hypothetical protein
VFENLEISFRRGRSVLGALAFRRDAEVRDWVEEFARTIFLSDHLDQYAELFSHAQKQWLGDRHVAYSGTRLYWTNLWPAWFGRACESRSAGGEVYLGH